MTPGAAEADCAPETPTAPQETQAHDLRVGRVVSVSGSQVIMLLDNTEIAGDLESPAALQIGALVKMYTMESTVFGMVSGLSIPIPSQDAAQTEMRIVEIELVGEAISTEAGSQATFKRGISFAPALGESVFAATQDDLKQVYARPNEASVRVGTIYQDQSLPAFVSVNDLLGKHFAVLGTTGTGKSCAAALILRKILSQHGSGHNLLLDLHNEYGPAFADCAEVMGQGNLELPYWLLNFEEISEIVIGSNHGDREADIAILKIAILDAKKTFHSAGEIAGVLTADTPVPYRLSDVTRKIDEELGRLD